MKQKIIDAINELLIITKLNPIYEGYFAIISTYTNMVIVGIEELDEEKINGGNIVSLLGKVKETHNEFRDTEMISVSEHNMAMAYAIDMAKLVIDILVEEYERSAT